LVVILSLVVWYKRRLDVLKHGDLPSTTCQASAKVEEVKSMSYSDFTLKRVKEKLDINVIEDRDLFSNITRNPNQ